MKITNTSCRCCCLHVAVSSLLWTLKDELSSFHKLNIFLTLVWSRSLPVFCDWRPDVRVLDSTTGIWNGEQTRKHFSNKMWAFLCVSAHQTRSLLSDKIRFELLTFFHYFPKDQLIRRICNCKLSRSPCLKETTRKLTWKHPVWLFSVKVRLKSHSTLKPFLEMFVFPDSFNVVIVHK